MLANILINAVEAICNADREDGVIQIEISAEYEWAIIKITDNGTGIEKKDINNIFQPFHTTKSRQKNWGVGLSYAYRVARAHFGYISVDSVKNEHTTFQILLLRKGV